jgi:hypothetical protein
VTLANPGALWLALLVPALIVLHFVRRRAIRTVVPSSLLWNEVLERLRETSLLRRYRHSLLLVLQVAAVAGLILGLARPHAPGAIAGRTVLVLDTSASMRARDGAPDRFEQARARALELVSRADGAGEIALVTADSQVDVIVPPSPDASAVKAALERVSPTDRPGPDPDELAGVLHELRRAGAGGDAEGIRRLGPARGCPRPPEPGLN